MFSLSALLFCVFSVFAQSNVTVTGTVSDENGEPLPGATVQVKGTPRGVTTDVDGTFSISVRTSDVLEFSFIGHQPIMIAVENQRRIDVKLPLKADELKEVTITAFGKQKKESVVSAIETVNVAELRIPSTNLTSALAGKISGLISYQLSGEPGADNANFFIRGVSSFEGTRSEPLILIDGFEATKNDLARIQPDDLETFSVMKDASAAVLYGARGANGIIMVTTKAGREGAPKISSRVDVIIATPTREKKVMDGVTYMRMYNEALLSRNPEAVAFYDEQKIQSTIRGENPMIYPNINWYNELFNKSTVNTKANLSISGGGQVATYYVAGGYDHENGLLKVANMNNFNNNISIDRIHIRNNVILKLGATTKLDTRLQGRFESYNGPHIPATNIFNSVMIANPVDHAIIYEPDEERMYADHILFGNTFDNNQQQKTNPFAEMVRGYESRNESSIRAQATLRQDLDFITKGLKMELMASADTWSKSSSKRSYIPFYYGLDSYNLVTGVHKLYCLNPTNTNYKLGNVNKEQDSDGKFHFETRITWSQKFGKHDLGASGIGYLDNKILTNGRNSTIFETLPERNAGISGRVTYGYDSRYFIEAAFGYNGSEKFAIDRAYGFFPSLGVGWLITNEPFWKLDKNIISNLKLKGTLGKVGSDNLGGRNARFFYLSQISRSGGLYIFGDDFLNGYNGYSISRYANADISWEVTYKYNAGIEIGLLKNETIKILFDTYFEDRRQIYEERRNYPHSTGFETPIKTNSGRVKTRGCEGSIDVQHNFTKDFFMTARGNFTYSVNEIIAKDEPNYRDKYRSQIGYATQQQWGLVGERLFVDDAEVANSPKQFDGNYMAGDIKYTDINGDGIINNEDQIPMGFPIGTPQIQYGFGMSTGYKSFDLSFFFQGNARTSFFINASTGGGDSGTEGIAPMVNRRNAMQIVGKDYWNETNPNVHAFWPRLSIRPMENNVRQSSWWLRNNGFTRLKTVELGYNVRDLKKLHISNLRFYFTGENMMLFSRFKLWDPEQGRNGLGYPLNKKFNFGVQVTF